jgi:hypothetical protein
MLTHAHNGMQLGGLTCTQGGTQLSHTHKRGRVARLQKHAPLPACSGATGGRAHAPLLWHASQHSSTPDVGHVL